MPTSHVFGSIRHTPGPEGSTSHEDGGKRFAHWSEEATLSLWSQEPEQKVAMFGQGVPINPTEKRLNQSQPYITSILKCTWTYLAPRITSTAFPLDPMMLRLFRLSRLMRMVRSDRCPGSGSRVLSMLLHGVALATPTKRNRVHRVPGRRNRTQDQREDLVFQTPETPRMTPKMCRVFRFCPQVGEDL